MENLLNRNCFYGFEQGVIDKLRYELPADSYYLISNGRIVESLDSIHPNDVFHVNFRLLGGKGGFGSILRSFRISKSTNQDMCRNLNGRRIRDVKEEERLRKWVAKKADREKEKERKKKEKYEKLKQGGPRHQFADVEYLRTRDCVLDQTEDAIEAGVSSLSASTSKETSKPMVIDKEPESSGDSDLETGFITVTKKKRKLVSVEKESVEVKRAKVDVECSKIEVTPKAPMIAELKKEENKPEEQPKQSKESHPKQPEEKIDYPEIDLNNFESAQELCVLGLGHLKHALESRGLKCGGTLEERAGRLFSVKGLKPKKYPKKLLAETKK